jgi:hypothetical protein
MYIVTKVGQLYPNNAKNLKLVEKAGLSYKLVDMSSFSDLEWEYLNAIRYETVYDWVLNRAMEHSKKAN